VNTVTIEVRWHRTLWAVQPESTHTLLLGEVPLGPTFGDSVSKAASEARLALAAEDSATGLEVVIAFDGSLLWPPLHASARQVLLALSPEETGKAQPYDEEARGRLVRSLIPDENTVPLGEGRSWEERIATVVARARALEPRAIAIALRGAPSRSSDEREAERALRDALPGVPVLLSSDIGPLWGTAEKPLEKTAVSAAILPLVREAAEGAREGLGRAGTKVWFASLDGTAVPSSLAERHPYAVLRGLPILSLTGALAYARELPGEGPIAAGSMHGTSTALARLPNRKAGESFDSALMGAHIESIGIGAESRMFLERGALTVADDRAPAGSLPVRAILTAAGLSDAEGAVDAATTVAGWLGEAPEAAVGKAMDALAGRLGTRLRLTFAGAKTGVFSGPLAGALAGLAGLQAGLDEVFLPPAFGACAALVARKAPRAARGAETLSPAPGGLTVEQALRGLEGLLRTGVADLEEGGLHRDSLAAVAWIAGSKGAHGIFPVLDPESIMKGVEGLLKAAPLGGPITFEVEVYPAAFDREIQFPELAAPLAAPDTRQVVLPGAKQALELRVVPSGALSEEAPTRGPALLADPTGLILVPQGAAATPAPVRGTRIARA